VTVITVVLAVERDDSPIVGFVAALDRLAQSDMPRNAVIGGVAVMCRLNAAHRPTADVDALVRDDASPTALEVLTRSGATLATDGVDLDGVHIDLLPVGDVPEEHDLPTDALARSFVLAHAWGLATAEPARVVAMDRAGNHLSSAEILVATAAALVSMKLHAIRSRRGSTSAKQGSDAYDLYRLLATLDRDGELGRVLRGAPHALGSWSAVEIEDLFVVDAERTALWIRNALADQMGGITADDVRGVGQDFVASLRRA
jgi:hypothetical protein